MTAPYAGAPVSQTFRERWMSGRQIGDAKPVASVEIRYGRLARKEHPWPGIGYPVFGEYHGARSTGFWYPDWKLSTDWMSLDGIQNIKLDQSLDNNGVQSIAMTMDNIKLTPATGPAGILYHLVDKGYYSPLRGYVGPKRPDPGVKQTPFFNLLPNAQLRIRQGYGSDAMVTTFLGLIDDVESDSVPNQLNITGRDFGGILVDEFFFGWAKEKVLRPPITFVPHLLRKKGHYIGIKDVSDIIRVVLRWCGFKYWEVENTGTNLQEPYVCDQAKTFMDIVNVVKDMVGYTFFMGEPRNDDDPADLGYPIFRNNRVMENFTGKTEFIDDRLLLTDAKVKISNQPDRGAIRCRGKAKDNGVTLGGDQVKRIMFTYIPPWAGEQSHKVAGVIKPITHTDQKFTTLTDCQFGCYLIAIKIALQKYTCILDLPANPGIGLDTLQSVIDRTQGFNSRVYVTNRTQEMQFGQNGHWTMELGGALVDTPDTAQVYKDYRKALKVLREHKKNPWRRKRKAEGYEDV